MNGATVEVVVRYSVDLSVFGLKREVQVRALLAHCGLYVY